MKSMKKALAAAISSILAAGMLSAMPAEAVREQLGTYRRIGDTKLYMSDSGAIWVESTDCAGVQFSIQLPAQQEADFRQTVWELLRKCCDLPEDKTKTVFDLKRDEWLTDTKVSGTAENPVYTYSLTAKSLNDGMFYIYMSDFYYRLHTAYSTPLQSFKYYADFGIVNSASCYGYDVSSNPEMKDKIDAWLAEHAPGVVTHMSDDDSILNLGWDETDGDMPYEPYNPYHDMYAIWQDLGYMPAKSAVTELYRHGDEFVIDFLQWQKYYDDISEETIQRTAVKYGLDKVRSNECRLWLGLSEDTVNELCRRSGSSYNTQQFYLPSQELVSEHDLAEGLNIGFAAYITLENDAPVSFINDSLFCAPEIMPQIARGTDSSASLADRLHEGAHILAFLDKYLGLPFKVCCADPAVPAPILRYSFDDMMKMNSSKLEQFTGMDFETALAKAKADQNRPDSVGLELLLEKETIEQFRVNVVPVTEDGSFTDFTLLSAQEIERFLSLPYGMVSAPESPALYFKKQKIGEKELESIFISIDTTIYGQKNRDKAYALAMECIRSTPGIYGMIMVTPAGGTDTQFTLGDVNLDNSRDVADAVLLARYCVSDTEAKITDQGLKQADINGDSAVTTADVTELLQIIAKKKVPRS